MEGISNSTLVLRISACVVGATFVTVGVISSAVCVTGILPGIGCLPQPALLIGGMVFTPNGILLLVLQVKKFATASGRNASNDTYPSFPIPSDIYPSPSMPRMRIEERMLERRSSSAREVASEQEEEMECEDLPENLRIIDLPSELLDLILSFLSSEDFVSAKLTCSHFNRVLNAPRFTKKLGRDLLQKAEAASNEFFVRKPRDDDRTIKLKLRIAGRRVLLHDTKSNRKRINQYRRKLVERCVKNGRYLKWHLCISELVKMGFYKEAWYEADKLVNRILEEKPLRPHSRITLWCLCKTLVLSIEKMAEEGRKKGALWAYRKLLVYRENEILHPEIKDLDISSAAIAAGDLDFVKNIIRERKFRVHPLLKMVKIFQAERTEENWQLVIKIARLSRPGLKKLHALIFLARSTGETELLSYELTFLSIYSKKWSGRLALYCLLLQAYFHLNEPEEINNMFNEGKRIILNYLENSSKYDKISKKKICSFLAIGIRLGLIQETTDLMDEIKIMVEQSHINRNLNSSELKDLYESFLHTFDKKTKELGGREDALTEEKDLTKSSYRQTKLFLNYFDEYLIPQLREAEKAQQDLKRKTEEKLEGV